MFDVIAGPGRVKFLAHAGILKQSEKLAAEIEGKWKESSDREILLEEWDEETVAYFVEWLYSNDYESPFPVKLPSSTPAKVKASKIFPGKAKKKGQDNHTSSKMADTTTGDTHRPLTPLSEIHFSYPSNRPIGYDQRFTEHVAKLTEAKDAFDYQHLLLIHAKVYALANYMLLPKLQSEALERLKSILHFIGSLSQLSNPQVSVIPNLVNLVTYVYANTNKLMSEEEPLRKLVSTYIASNFVCFDGEGVQELIERGGDFVLDVWQKARRDVASKKPLSKPGASEFEAIWR